MSWTDVLLFTFATACLLGMLALCATSGRPL
jgi:hypothetical protein